MRRPVDAPRQAANDCDAGARQTAGQSLGLLQSVMCGMPCAYNRHGQRIARLEFPAHEQNPRRIGQIQQRRRIAFDAFRENIDAGRTTAFDLGFGIDFVARTCNCATQFRAYPGNSRRIGRRGISTASGVPNRSSSLHRMRGPTPETIDNRTVAAKDAASTDVPKLPDIRSPFDGANPSAGARRIHAKRTATL